MREAAAGQTQTGIAVSLVVGLLAAVLSLGLPTAAFLTRSGRLSGDTSDSLVVWAFALTPLVALLNIIFVDRDNRAGRSQAAGIGGLLSVVAFLLWLLPLAFAD